MSENRIFYLRIVAGLLRILFSGDRVGVFVARGHVIGGEGLMADMWRGGLCYLLVAVSGYDVRWRRDGQLDGDMMPTVSCWESLLGEPLDGEVWSL